MHERKNRRAEAMTMKPSERILEIQLEILGLRKEDWQKSSLEHLLSDPISKSAAIILLLSSALACSAALARAFCKPELRPSTKRTAP